MFIYCSNAVMFWDVSSWHRYKGLWGFLLFNLWRKHYRRRASTSQRPNRHLQKLSRGARRREEASTENDLFIGLAVIRWKQTGHFLSGSVRLFIQADESTPHHVCVSHLTVTSHMISACRQLLLWFGSTWIKLNKHHAADSTLCSPSMDYTSVDSLTL